MHFKDKTEDKIWSSIVSGREHSHCMDFIFLPLQYNTDCGKMEQLLKNTGKKKGIFEVRGENFVKYDAFKITL